MSKVNIRGREYISLSRLFFLEVMQKIDSNYEYDEDYVPTIRKRVLDFSSKNIDDSKVLVTTKLFRWMEIEYDKTPLPWRPLKGDTYVR